MIFYPIAKSIKTLTKSELVKDIRDRKKFGGCSLGRKAVYLSFWEFANCMYIPLTSITRVYKRLAVSKGFYNGTTFGTIAYLVVEYDDSKKSITRFRNEEDVNSLLQAIRNATDIPIGKKK